MATDKRLLELALQALQTQRDQLEREISELRDRLGGRQKTTVRKTAARKKKATSRKMGAAQRKALSESMKKAWARRKKAKKKR